VAGRINSLFAVGGARAVHSVLAFFLIIIGLSQFTEGLYIALKAEVAQLLLKQAWAETLEKQTPQKPWPWFDTWPIARMVVPELDEETIILKGVSGQTLAFGPGWLETRGTIGEPGVALIAAHNDTHFSYLKDLKIGQTFYIETINGQKHTFKITDFKIVDTRKKLFLEKTEGSYLILSTCYPFDALVSQTPFRYLAFARGLD